VLAPQLCGDLTHLGVGKPVLTVVGIEHWFPPFLL
jgi:hypothetical protein